MYALTEVVLFKPERREGIDAQESCCFQSIVIMLFVLMNWQTKGMVLFIYDTMSDDIMSDDIIDDVISDNGFQATVWQQANIGKKDHDLTHQGYVVYNWNPYVYSGSTVSLFVLFCCC